MKRILLISLFSVYFSGWIWAQEYKVRPGITITKDNHGKYLPELKRLLPDAVFPHHINGLKKGWITMPIVKPEYPILNLAYIEASKNNKGNFKVGPGNKLIGKERWKAGAPFPDPITAKELAWSSWRRIDSTDDCSFPCKFFLYDKNIKLERTIKAHIGKKMWVGRLLFPPVPEFPGNNGFIYYKEHIVILEPFDIRGFCMLRIGYDALDKSDDTYSYIPALRRIRRLTGSDVTDPMLGTDCCYDDFEVWKQKINHKMTFKMEDTEVIVDHRVLNERPEQVFVRNCFQTEWEIRPVWLLEINTNDPDYAYSKRLLYISRDSGSFNLPYGEYYDQKGRLFRTSHVHHAFSKHEGDWYSNVAYGYIWRNHVNEHSSILNQYPIWHDPECTIDRYTIRGLLKIAR